jgi:diacylglycerol kinase (ATP)
VKIGLIVNPRSRKNARDPGAAARLEAQLGSAGMLRQTRTRDEVTTIAREFRDAGVDVLALAGGDGTTHVTLTGFLREYGETRLPAIALLRGGTMNTVANSIGVPRGNPESLLARLLRMRERGMAPAATERHAILLGDGVREHAGFLFGAGVVHGFLAEYYRGGQPSPLVAVQTLVRGVASAAIGGETIRRMARPFRGSVVVDGDTWPCRDYLTVTGGAVDQIGLGFRPFPRASERPGSFQLLGIHASPFGFSLELPQVFRGRPLSPDTAYDALTAHARLEPVDSPLAYMIDGDLHSCDGPLDVRSGPAIRLLV